jgi:SAM-dependent methyltransferase
MAEKPDYGIDAPTVVRNLLLAAAASVLITIVFPRPTIGHVTFVLNPGLFYTAAWLTVPAVLMLHYSKAGKFRHRDLMLAKLHWTGTETVLDVGSGRGLLLIGAAKLLSTGHAIGIDIWSTVDLSGNSPEAVKKNITLEGVEGKADIRSEDARTMSFADESFDVVLTNACLHNIHPGEGRRQACCEIARVLKPRGLVVISDFQHIREYAREFRKAGFSVEMGPLGWFVTFPPLRILVAQKPA